MKRNRCLLVVLSTLVAASLTACGKPDKPPATTTIPSGEAAPSTVPGPTDSTAATQPGAPPATSASAPQVKTIQYSGAVTRTVDAAAAIASCTTSMSEEGGLYEVHVHDPAASQDRDFPGFRVTIATETDQNPYLPSGRFLSSDQNSPSEVTIDAYTSEDVGYGAFGEIARDGSSYEVTVANGALSGTVKAKAVPLSESSGSAPLTIEGAWECKTVEQISGLPDETE